jgi:hypothetical protein
MDVLSVLQKKQEIERKDLNKALLLAAEHYHL